jgi:hypothetical protein
MPDTTSFRCMYVRSSSNTHPACSSSKEQPACKRKRIRVCAYWTRNTTMFLSQDIWVMMKIVMTQPPQDISPISAQTYSQWYCAPKTPIERLDKSRYQFFLPCFKNFSMFRSASITHWQCVCYFPRSASQNHRYIEIS